MNILQHPHMSQLLAACNSDTECTKQEDFEFSSNNNIFALTTDASISPEHLLNDSDHEEEPILAPVPPALAHIPQQQQHEDNFASQQHLLPQLQIARFALDERVQRHTLHPHMMKLEEAFTKESILPSFPAIPSMHIDYSLDDFLVSLHHSSTIIPLLLSNTNALFDV